MTEPNELEEARQWHMENRVEFLTGETVLVQFKKDEPFREVPYLDESAMLAAYASHRNAALVKRVGELEQALASDAAGRTVPELLKTAADILYQQGGGPVEDCLRLKADELSELLAADSTAERKA